MLNNARAQVHTHQFPHRCSIGLGIAFSKRFPITDCKGYRLGSLTMDACEKRRALCHMGSSICFVGLFRGHCMMLILKIGTQTIWYGVKSVLYIDVNHILFHHYWLLLRSIWNSRAVDSNFGYTMWQDIVVHWSDPFTKQWSSITRINDIRNIKHFSSADWWAYSFKLGHQTVV